MNTVKTKDQLKFVDPAKVYVGSPVYSSWFQAITDNLNNEYEAVYGTKTNITDRITQVGHDHSGDGRGVYMPKNIWSQNFGLPRYWNSTYSNTLDHLIVDTSAWTVKWITTSSSIVNPEINGADQFLSPGTVYTEANKYYVLIEKPLIISAGATELHIATNYGINANSDDVTFRTELANINGKKVYDDYELAYAAVNKHHPEWRTHTLTLPSRNKTIQPYILRVGVIFADGIGDFRLYGISVAER